MVPNGSGGYEAQYGGDIHRRFAADQLLNAELAFPITRGATIGGGLYDLAHQGAGNAADYRTGDALRGINLGQTGDTMRLSGFLGPLGRYAPNTTRIGLGGLGIGVGGIEVYNGNYEQGALDLGLGAYALLPRIAIPGRTAVEALADSFRGQLNSGGPRTVARLVTPNGTFNGRSGYSGEPHPVAQQVLDSIPPNMRAPWHGECAEVDAVSQALRATEMGTRQGITTVAQALQALAGSFIQTARVRGPNSLAHGTPIPLCDSCVPFLDALGIPCR